MRRLHVHVSVDDLAQSTRFYSTVFAAEPTEYGAMNDLLAYLTENCCGRGQSCAPAACNPAR